MRLRRRTRWQKYLTPDESTKTSVHNNWNSSFVRQVYRCYTNQIKTIQTWINQIVSLLFYFNKWYYYFRLICYVTEKAKSDISYSYISKTFNQCTVLSKKDLATKELIINLLKINSNYVLETSWLSFLT